MQISIVLFCFFCSILCQSSKKTYYDELKVTKDSTAGEIKKAYFNIVKDCHPDKVKDWENDVVAKTKYEKYSKIYAVLSDSLKKKRYDELVSFGKYEYDDALYNHEDRKESESQQEKSRKTKKKGSSSEEEDKNRERQYTGPNNQSSMMYIFIGAIIFVYFIYSTLSKPSTTAPVNNDKKDNNKKKK
jgi:DnaJ-class molecular chaperone